MSSVSSAPSSAAMAGFRSTLDTIKRTGETLAMDMAEGSRRIREQSEGIKSVLNKDVGGEVDISV